MERVDEKYVEQALNLALGEYHNEKQIVKDLPDIDFQDKIRGLLTYLFQQKYGVVALENDNVVGYMAFFSPIDGFFGNCKGAFSPLGGSAFLEHDRQITASKIMAAATEMLVNEEGVTSFAVCRYANDVEVASTFVLNGFGIRCSDAIMKLEESSTCNIQTKGITIRELQNDEKPLILPLRKELTMHLLKSPIYFPTHIGNYMDWFKREDVRVFAAFEESEIIGYMSIQEEGETLISEIENMANLCGTFVKEEYRGKHVADDLLHHVSEICKQEGKEYLGVDCETLNPNALRFWGKYFNNYTYSYHRRIDERVIGYQSYLEKEWGI